MTAERLMAQLDGAKLVRYDSNAAAVYAWFGAHGVHAYDAAGVEFDYWSVGDFAQDAATYQEVFESMSYRMLNLDGLEATAYELGAEHGENAAAWYFDGNTTQETYEWVARGIAEGDPAVYDTFPTNPLSGEHADGLTPDGLLRLLDLDPYDFPPEAASDLCRMYEDAYDVAVSDTIARDCRAALATV